jgi:Cdc6-like AAA superfamily ATPase
VATTAEVAALRLMVAIPDDLPPYTDELLAARLDAAGSAQALAAQIWREKAAQFAELVNTSESGSSRNLSDLHKNALAMAQHWAGQVPDDSSTQSGVVVRKLTRR